MANNKNRKQSDESTPKRRWTLGVIALLTVLVIVNITVLVVRQSPSTSSTVTTNAAVFGVVVNTAGEPVPDAVVYIEGMGQSVTTDDTGSFTLRPVPIGDVELVIGVTPDPPQFYTVNVPDNDIQNVGQMVYDLAN